MSEALKPCPWCGAGETRLEENGRVWTGMRYGEPSSVSVRHWCAPVKGQPSRMIERVGRDRESAIAAWNRRAEVQRLSEASAPVNYHREDEGSESAESYAKLMARLDEKGRRTLANLVAHGAKAVLAPDGAVVLTRGDWAELRVLRASSAPAVPHGWKLVPLEPTGEMLEAMARYAEGFPNARPLPALWRWTEVYRAALSASPAPPEEKEPTA